MTMEAKLARWLTAPAETEQLHKLNVLEEMKKSLYHWVFNIDL